MKKLLLLAIIMIASISSAFAGPFGLEMGMNHDEITKACGGIRPEKMGNDDRYLISPTKSHPDFEEYIAWVDGNKGLYYLKTISKPIHTSKYGNELKSDFFNMVDRLSNSYGKARIVDEIRDSASKLWGGDDYWMYTLQNDDRRLAAAWEKNKEHTNLPAEFNFVALWAVAEKIGYTGRLMIEYEFANYEEIKKSQDDVF